MDPISSSCFSLHIEENARAILEEQKQEEQFNEILVSCRSLSRYESRAFKTLWPQIFAAIIGASFHIVVGVSLAYSAILIPQLEDSGKLNNTEKYSNDTRQSFTITENQGSWIASVIVVVAPIGSIMGGFMMDSIGRLNTIKLAAIPGAIGWICIATANNVPMLIIGRILTGFASSWGTSPAIVYITEISRADMRGSLISAAPTYASFGMVLAYLEGWFLNWRTVAWICNVYTIIPAFLVLLIPESPAWLVSKGRITEARNSLQWLYKYQPQPQDKSLTFAELQLGVLQKEQTLKKEEMAKRLRRGNSSKVKQFLLPTGYKPILILTGLFFFQQFSGIYITLFYAVTFFKEMGSDINPYLASIFIGTVRFIMSMVNTWLLRTYHRRPLIIVSATGMAICMFVSGYFTAKVHEGEHQYSWIPMVALLLYVVTSMFGLLSIPWTMTAELFPLEIRGVAHSIAYGTANFIMFAAIQSYRDLAHAFGGSDGVQYFFAVIALGGLIYAYIFLPETHGKKLSEITEYFMHNTMAVGKSSKTRQLKTNGDKSKEYIKVTPNENK